MCLSRTDGRVQWTRRDRADQIEPYYETSKEDRVYLLQEGGRMTCLDADTGQPVYEQERLAAPGPYYASPVAADGRLYLCSLAGVVTVLTAGDRPSVLASNPLGETTAASPAVIDSTLYVRTSRHLYAFRETKLP